MVRRPSLKRLPVAFFENDIGTMPVREWLLSLSDEDRKIIGDDIRTAEFGWPVGMPICRSLTGYKGAVGNSQQAQPRPDKPRTVLRA
jgi:hypothetical protein